MVAAAAAVLSEESYYEHFLEMITEQCTNTQIDSLPSFLAIMTETDREMCKAYQVLAFKDFQLWGGDFYAFMNKKI